MTHGGSWITFWSKRSCICWINYTFYQHWSMTWVNRKRYFFNSYDLFFQSNWHRTITKYSDSAVRRWFSKKVFLKISQYSQESICVGVLESLLNKVADLQLCNFIKNRLHHRCFLKDFWLLLSAESHNRLSLVLCFTFFL